MISKKLKNICLIIFIIYILLLLNITVFRFGFYLDERSINISLFTDLINMYQIHGLTIFLWLFLGNTLGFAPFGFFLPILIKKESLFIVVFLGFTFSVFIELSQLTFYKGVAELDDLILNTIGVAIGYLVYRYTIKRKN